MSKKVVLPHETLMYSVHKETGHIVTHHLPWPKDNPQLEYYLAKGFTFERPPDKEVVVEMPKRDIKRRKIKHKKVKA